MKFNYFGKNTEKNFNRCLVITSFNAGEIKNVEKACNELDLHTVSVSELFENDEKEVYALEVVADFDNIKDAKEIYKEIKELVKSVDNEITNVLENALERTEQENALERTEQKTYTSWCVVDDDVNLMTAKHETLEKAIDDFVQQIENKGITDMCGIQNTIETYCATACLMVFDDLGRIRKYKETINCADLFRMIKEKKEVNTMNVLEKALATTEKKIRERRHYFATKGARGISIFSNTNRPDLYVFSTWIARKKWIEEQETRVDIAVMERTATECKQAYSHIVDGVREWDNDVYFM